jgi:hypothetical protein
VQKKPPRTPSKVKPPEDAPAGAADPLARFFGSIPALQRLQATLEGGPPRCPHCAQPLARYPEGWTCLRCAFDRWQQQPDKPICPRCRGALARFAGPELAQGWTCPRCHEPAELVEGPRVVVAGNCMGCGGPLPNDGRMFFCDVCARRARNDCDGDPDRKGAAALQSLINDWQRRADELVRAGELVEASAYRVCSLELGLLFGRVSEDTRAKPTGVCGVPAVLGPLDLRASDRASLPGMRCRGDRVSAAGGAGMIMDPERESREILRACLEGLPEAERSELAAFLLSTLPEKPNDVSAAAALRVELNLALSALWRIAGCPAGRIDLSVCEKAEARVAALAGKVRE